MFEEPHSTLFMIEVLGSFLFVSEKLDSIVLANLDSSLLVLGAASGSAPFAIEKLESIILENLNSFPCVLQALDSYTFVTKDVALIPLEAGFLSKNVIHSYASTSSLFLLYLSAHIICLITSSL